MNQKIVLLIVLSGIVLVTSCVQQIPQNEIQFIDMNTKQFINMNEEILQRCISAFHARDGQEFIINSQEEYNSLLEFKSPADYCDDFKLPIIDFAINTLLGKYTQGGGCSINFERHVYKDESNKKIIYSIKVVEEGACEKLGVSMNWILIPKVPSDYTIEFEVK